MTISLWFMAWTPYLVINYTGVFESAPITPLATIWGSLFAKANAVYNPIVYGIRYVEYRYLYAKILSYYDPEIHTYTYRHPTLYLLFEVSAVCDPYYTMFWPGTCYVIVGVVSKYFASFLLSKPQNQTELLVGSCDYP